MLLNRIKNGCCSEKFLKNNVTEICSCLVIISLYNFMIVFIFGHLIYGQFLVDFAKMSHF